MKGRLLFSVIAVAVLSATVHAQAPVRVYVTSVGAQNGFTDPSKDNRDTVKDLRDSLEDRKGLALVDAQEGAEIVLTVLGRETSQITAGFLGGPARDRILRVRFVAGGSETELSASAQGGTIGSGGAWGKAAGKIAKQVEDWVKQNRARLP